MNYLFPTPINNKIIIGDAYKGLPIAECPDGFFAKNLDDALTTIDGAMADSPRLIVANFCLYIPNGIASVTDRYTDDTVLEFVKRLEQKSQWNQSGSATAKDRNRKAKIDYIIGKDYDGKKKRFRVMLLMNPEAYIKQHAYHADMDTLIYRIRTIWSQVLKVADNLTHNLVKFLCQKVIFVDDSADSLARLFKKASNLCMATTINYGQGSYSFYSSRQYRE